ncbi:MAG TPA: DNA translocase FtsK [Gemmatimonadaceae bacterium]|nr:DNA translocase FtsK [Gemmatimonadaceae bacterium]
MGSTHLKRELSGIALLLFAVFLGGALAAGGLARLGTGVDARAFGWVGEYLGAPLVAVLGWPAAALVPLLPAVKSLRYFGRVARPESRPWAALLAGLVALLPVALGVALGGPREVDPLVGLWGGFTSYYMRMWFGPAGAWIVVLFAASALTAATLRWHPIRALVGPAPGPPEAADPKPPRAKRRRGGADEPPALDEPAPEEMPAMDPALMAATAAAKEDAADGGGERRRRKRSRADVAAERDEQIAAALEATAEPAIAAGEALPPTTLLTDAPGKNHELNKRELDTLGVRLMDALRTFKVHGELSGYTNGPVVTQFEIEPAPGVKVRQIANLASDLALAMRAPSIRIVAPIPGRGAVGVEVPNPSPEMVHFRELLESSEYRKAWALPIALGKDLEGKPVVADLAKMPHLLIAGATGSGKSVCVNTIITSLVYKHTPRTLRFLMVDPKMVELSVYNTLPHLRHKVITDNRDAAAVLKWAVMEMQERYELLAANGCRNIQDFNRRVADAAPLKRPKDPAVAFEDLEYKGGLLPYIVVVIDEMADLMMTVQGEVETPIAMLAQKARAIGIHLILATQRPSVNVITGLIKANFPSRIAFRVASQVDSRTIIDGAGAEALLGNGDMLFIPPGKSEPSRLQGAYIGSEDTERLMRWYDEQRAARRRAFEAQGLVLEEGTQAEPDILETVRQREAQDAGGDAEAAEEGERDKLFREAAEVVVQHQQGSTSLLQRRLKVGYGRAARIIDQLHLAGILGPPDGSKPRDVLVGLEDLDRICGPKG